MRVTVESVRFDGAGIAGRLGERLPAMTRALGEAVMEASEPYVPYRTGALCRSVSLSPGADGRSAEVRWSVPYAAECYYAARPFSKRTWDVSEDSGYFRRYASSSSMKPAVCILAAQRAE